MGHITDHDGYIEIQDNEDNPQFRVYDDGQFNGLTLKDATDITVSATTGSKIGQSTSKLGFYGVTPAVRPTALVQTYSTAAATNPAMTAVAPATTAASTAAAAAGYATKTQANAVALGVKALVTDVTDHKKFVNKIVDQLQAIGLLQ